MLQTFLNARVKKLAKLPKGFLKTSPTGDIFHNEIQLKCQISKIIFFFCNTAIKSTGTNKLHCVLNIFIS